MLNALIIPCGFLFMPKTNGKIIWHSEKRKISELNPAKYNPRELTEKQMQDLSTSLEKFSLVDPIVINRNNTIVGGHQRINILKQKYGNNGVEVDVRVPSKLLTQNEEVELNLRLNKNLGQWDFDALANFDEELLKDVGFDSKELDKIFQLDMPNEDEIPPERAETGVVLGDLYALGQHRLLCGDATQKADVERLMAGEKADMVFTDPPYGILYLAENKRLKDMGHLESDTKDRVLFKEFLYNSLKNCINSLREGGVYYIFMSWQFIGQIVEKLYELKADGHNMLVWDRETPRFTQYPQDHIPNCEFFLYGWKKGQKRYLQMDGGDQKTTIWRFKTMRGKDMQHPTQKPVELPANAISRSSQRNFIILDLFGGSGSTLIACQKLNRKCRMMEIDPVYCQVILDRWEKFTNQKAIKLNDLSMAENDRSMASIR